MALSNPHDRPRLGADAAGRAGHDDHDDRLSILLDDAREAIALARAELAVESTGETPSRRTTDAEALRGAFATVSEDAGLRRLYALAEIAESCEAVFAALARSSLELSGDERAFLLNVMAALAEICDRLDRHETVTGSLELIGDGIDRLLVRLESA